MATPSVVSKGDLESTAVYFRASAITTFSSLHPQMLWESRVEARCSEMLTLVIR
jgi:hypothetical protein